MPSDLNARYGLNPAHSEVVEACRTIAPCLALDMGCGGGRNALYLAERGFEVVAVDHNPNALAALRGIVEAEGLERVEVVQYDLNEARLDRDYGFIACTVTLMFLRPDRVPEVIGDMQAHTLAGGCNLIVCAMDTATTPCPIGFPFTFGEGALKDTYAGWEVLKYNEDLGTMHNGAQLQFATLLARKPAA